MTLPILVGIHGKAGSGKDSIARYLRDMYRDVYTEAFADPLKRACAEAFGIDEWVFSDTIKKEEQTDFWGVSPREIAQFVGTELFRDHVSKLVGDVLHESRDFWIRRLSGKLSGAILRDGEGQYDENDIVCITDVRFQNEYEWIMNNDGILIHVTREGQDGNVGIVGHSSEAGINTDVCPEQSFLVTNNSSLGDLYNAIDKIIRQSHLRTKFIPRIER